MATKKQIIAQIQTIANEYLRTKTLRFEPTYIRLTKPELEERLVTAQKMIKLHREVEALRAKYTKNEWDMVAIFPLTCSEELRADREKLNDLIRQTSDLWHLV